MRSLESSMKYFKKETVLKNVPEKLKGRKTEILKGIILTMNTWRLTNLKEIKFKVHTQNDLGKFLLEFVNYIWHKLQLGI